MHVLCMNIMYFNVQHVNMSFYMFLLSLSNVLIVVKKGPFDEQLCFCTFVVVKYNHIATFVNSTTVTENNCITTIHVSEFKKDIYNNNMYLTYICDNGFYSSKA